MVPKTQQWMKNMSQICAYDRFLALTRSEFSKISDSRQKIKVEIPLVDHLMSALGIFALKVPSLLKYDEQIRSNPESVEAKNFKNLFGVNKTPDDTCMRQTIDMVQWQELRGAFTAVFADIQKNKGLEQFVFFRGSYLLAIDGTGYFSSHQVHCPNCCEKHHRDGTVTYHHQMLGAALIHPDVKQVIPLAPEPIQMQDGNKKNDCERNAAKRLLAEIRSDHPHLDITVTEDALSSNFPHVQELKKHKMHFILGIKPGDHKNFFERLGEDALAGLVKNFREEKDGLIYEYRFINDILLKEDTVESLVNYFECKETNTKGETKTFSWITDFTVSTSNIEKLMKGGRARWRIENEVFNTLKNQGYQFEHNFGHGKKNLSTNFANLMMLAFLFDQVSEILCKVYNAARKNAGPKYSLWEKMRNHFSNVVLDSWVVLFKIVSGEYKLKYTIEPAVDSG